MVVLYMVAKLADGFESDTHSLSVLLISEPLLAVTAHQPSLEGTHLCASFAEVNIQLVVGHW